MFRLGLGVGFGLGFEVIHQHVLCTYQGFIQDVLLGGAHWLKALPTRPNALAEGAADKAERTG